MNLLEQEVYIDLGGQETPSSPTSHLKEDILTYVYRITMKPLVYNMYAQGGMNFNMP